MRKLNYLLILVTLVCISLISASNCPVGIYPCDNTISVINTIKTSSSSIVTNDCGAGNCVQSTIGGYVCVPCGSSGSINYTNIVMLNVTINNMTFYNLNVTNNLNVSKNLSTQGITVSKIDGTNGNIYTESTGRLVLGRFTNNFITGVYTLAHDLTLATNDQVDFINTGGQDTMKMVPATGDYEDSIFSSRRRYSSAFQFLTPASGSGNQGFTVRGSGSGNGDKFGFWNDYPNDFFDVTTSSTFRNQSRMMGGLIVGDGTQLGNEKISNGGLVDGSSNVFCNGNWTIGSGWSWSSCYPRKSADGIGTLSQTSAQMQTPLVVGEIYKLVIYIQYQSSPFDYAIPMVSCGGVTMGGGTADTANYVTLYFKAISTADLIITPTLDTRYYITYVSLKKVTGGNIDVAGNINAQNITATKYNSTVANGIQPYATKSSTLNTNLNADLLDGNHASAFDTPIDCGAGNVLQAVGSGTSTCVTSGTPIFPTNQDLYTYSDVAFNSIQIAGGYSMGTTIDMIGINTNKLHADMTDPLGTVDTPSSWEVALNLETTVPFTKKGCYKFFDGKQSIAWNELTGDYWQGSSACYDLNKVHPDGNTKSLGALNSGYYLNFTDYSYFRVQVIKTSGNSTTVIIKVPIEEAVSLK